MNAQLTIDLNSVSYIKFFYRQQEGIERRTRLRWSVHGENLKDKDEFAFPYLVEYPLETRIERARRMEILDVWTAVCVYQFRNNHSIEFTGQQAIKKRNAYNYHIYGKSKHKRDTRREQTSHSA